MTFSSVSKGSFTAELRRFRHNDMQDLEQQLQKAAGMGGGTVDTVDSGTGTNTLDYGLAATPVNIALTSIADSLLACSCS